MTTITDILAEAFNRVKNEHGVTLSRVEFALASGNLAGLSFKAAGVFKLGLSSPYGVMPPLAPVPFPTQHYDDKTSQSFTLSDISIIPGESTDEQFVQAPSPAPAPEGATHYGSLDGGDPSYYRYAHGVLGWYIGDGLWGPYITHSDATDAELVEQLTALQVPKDELVEMTPEQIEALRKRVSAKPVPASVLEGATHYGDVGAYDDCFWKFESGRLYMWDHGWMLCDSGESAQVTVDSQLTPINPA